MKKTFICLFFIILLSATAFGGVILSDQGTGVKSKSTGDLLELGNITISIYDSVTGGSQIFTEFFEDAIVNGSWNVLLGENSSNELNLKFGNTYYTEYAINGEDVDFVDYQGNTVERKIFVSPMGDIEGDDLASDITINTTGNVTGNYSFFEYLGSLVDKVVMLFVDDVNVSNTIILNGTAIDDWSDVSGSADTQKGTSGSYLYNDTDTIYFNESFLNATIDARDDYAANTEKSGAGKYMYNDSDSIYLNETVLNSTIDARGAGDTQKNATGYLYNDSTTVYLNETRLNATIDARDDYEADTQKTTSGSYLYNDSTTIHFNESKLNATIDARGSGGDNASWNESYANTLYILQSNEGSLNVNSSSYANASTYWASLNTWLSGWFVNNGGVLEFNDTKLNATIDARDNFEANTEKSGAGKYMYNDSDSIYLNETTLNATIDARGAGDTQKNASGYLYNDSTTIYLNETKLNTTIDARDGDTLAGLSCSNSQVPKWNNTGSVWYCADDSLGSNTTGDIDAVNTAGDYLYGGTTSGTADLFLNETKLNATIDARDNFEANTEKSGAGKYMYNDSDSIYLNETVLNSTISSLDTNTQRSTTGFYLYNDSTKIYFNESQLNATVESLDDDTLGSLSCSLNQFVQWNGSEWKCVTSTSSNDTQKTTSGPYLYNDSTVIYFNETYLNGTIDARDNFEANTEKSGAGKYMYNDSDSIYLNETVLNSTIDARGAGDNASWNESYADTKYILQSNEGNLNVNSSLFANASTWWASLNTWLSGWFVNNGGQLEFNETKLNATIDARDNFEANTEKSGAGKYMYNDSDSIYLNETVLNSTISSLDTNTQRAGAGIYLYNDSTTMYFNETKLNSTINSLENDTLGSLSCSLNEYVQWNGSEWKCVASTSSNDTQKTTSGPYLYNDSTVIYFNETYLNSTIDARDNFEANTEKSGAGKYMYNDSNSIYLNETTLNATIDARAGGDNASWNESYANTLYILQSNEGNLNVNSSLFANASTWWASLNTWLSGWFVNNGGQLEFNETKLNSTIDARDTDTHVAGEGTYLYNDSNTMYLNETKLNATIDARGSGDTQKNASGYLYNDSTTMYLNETKLNATIQALDQFEANTEKSGAGKYMYNDSTSIYLNETVLNSTIDARDTDTQKTTATKYLYNDTTTVYFNESELNTTIQALDQFEADTQKSAGTKYLYNDSTVIYFNETELNTTIQALDQFEANTEKSGAGKYMYNDSTSIYLNESVLNSTINLLENDTHVAGDLIYLYNDTTTMYLNETKLNATIDARASGDNVSWNESYADTKYLNLSGTNANQDINIAPYNFLSGNLTVTQKITFALGEFIDNIVDGWVRINGGINVTGDALVGSDLNVSGNITTEGIDFEQDPTNHRVYDNSTCVIVTGDTSTLYIC